MAARSYYRLYIDGKIIMNGPARTAAGYCRVDKISIELLPNADLAIEVIALDKPEKYCNDCTLEAGLLAAEAVDEDGNVLAATGRDFRCKELTFRRMQVETMSHSRGILEWYDLTENDLAWIHGEGEGWFYPEAVPEHVVFLPRRAPYPTMQTLDGLRLDEIADLRDSGQEADSDLILTIAETINSRWYQEIPDEKRFLRSLRALEEQPFTGHTEVDSRGKRAGFASLPHFCIGLDGEASTWPQQKIK